MLYKAKAILILERQMRISGFGFVSVAQPQKIGIKQMMDKTRQAKNTPSEDTSADAIRETG